MRAKIFLRAALGALGLVLAFLLLAPTDVEPVSWKAPPPPSRESGAFASNERLKPIERIQVLGGHGPESVVPDGKGSIYTGLKDGRILRLSEDGSRPEVFAQTGGRPLGMCFHPDGSLIVCDAIKGLLRVDAKGAVTLLTSEAEGVPFHFTDDVAIDREGKRAYFTDASSKWGWGRHSEDILEHGGHGRLLRYDFETKATTVLMRGIQFANGVALGPDDAYVLVNETGSYRVLRYHISGEKAGKDDVFCENLPGTPDNITFNGKDTFWVALFSPRDPLLDKLSETPFARKCIARLLLVATPPFEHRSLAIGLGLDGQVKANLQYGGAGAFAPITEVREVGAWMYFGSLEEECLGRMPLAAAR